MWIAIGVLGFLTAINSIIIFLISRELDYLRQEIGSTAFNLSELNERHLTTKKLVKEFINHLGYQIRDTGVAFFFKKEDGEHWREDQKQRIEMMMFNRQLTTLKEELLKIKENSEALSNKVDRPTLHDVMTSEVMRDNNELLVKMLEHFKLGVVKYPAGIKLEKITKRSRMVAGDSCCKAPVYSGSYGR